jgi:hypothetical protein
VDQPAAARFRPSKEIAAELAQTTKQQNDFGIGF